MIDHGVPIRTVVFFPLTRSTAGQATVLSWKGVWVKSAGVPYDGTQTERNEGKDGEDSLHREENGEV